MHVCLQNKLKESTQECVYIRGVLKPLSEPSLESTVEVMASRNIGVLFLLLGVASAMYDGE